MKAQLLPFLSIVLAGPWIGPSPCFADWTKTIDCPAGREYRDERPHAGRYEFCELLLPGSLKVYDGPYRSWFSEGHPGEEGSYRNGRKVGRWKECNRFGRCHDQTYELVSSEELARGVKPVIPVSYTGGKYTFDFGSCWSTWVRHQPAESLVELNIRRGLVRCEIAYIPFESERPAGDYSSYYCQIPYSVGVRQFDSLDLRKELPKAGLPRFCGDNDPPATTPLPDGPPDQGFAIWVNQRYVNADTGKETRGWMTLANLVDVECAAIDSQPGAERLTVRLNTYVEKLVLERAGNDELKADVCGGGIPLSPLGTLTDSSGRSLFSYGFSKDPAKAKRQRRCITNQITLHSSCASQ